MARIAFFLPSLTSGGAESVTVTLADEIARSHSVDLLVASHTGELAQSIPKSVNLLDLNTRKVSLAVPKIALYLRKHRPACIMFSLIYANILGVIATKLACSSTRIVLREAVHPSQYLGRRRGLMVRIIKSLLRPSYRRSDHIIAVSQGVATDLIENFGLPPSMITVIYNPTVTPSLHSMAREQIDGGWVANPNEKVVLAAGRLVQDKDYPTLIRAFHLVQQKLDCKLVILGDGQLLGKLADQVKQLGLADKVCFAGFQPNPFKHMARADVFVLSSTNEGLPNVLIQAMACGTTVVSTDCESGPREILECGKYGTLVPPGDAAALSQAILDALRQPRDSAMLKRRADDYRSDIIAEEYLEVMLG